MKNCLTKILDTLKSHTALGELHYFTVFPDGSSQAIYRHGTQDWDPDGKPKFAVPLADLTTEH